MGAGGGEKLEQRFLLLRGKVFLNSAPTGDSVFDGLPGSVNLSEM